MSKKKIKDLVKDIEDRVTEAAPFRSSFPTAHMLKGGVYGAYGEDFKENYISNIQELSKLSYGKILWKWDAATKEVLDFGGFVEAFDGFSVSELVDAWNAIQSGDSLEIAKEVVDTIGLIWASVGTSAQFYEEIPIVGIFVALAQFAVDLSLDTRKSMKEYYYPIEGLKMDYDRETDEFIVNDALERLENKDWTTIFAPPIFSVPGNHGDPRASGVEHTNVKWAEGRGQGVVITLTGGKGLPGHIYTGLGFHPQTARIPIAWQYHTGDPERRKTRKGWTYKKGLNINVTGFETYHPATQQMSVLLWERLLKNRPEIYRVDANGLRNSWSSYFRTMEEYLTRKSDKYGMSNTAEYVRPMTRGVIERILSPEYWGSDPAIKRKKVVATSEGNRIHWSVLGKDVPLSYYSDPKKLILTGISDDYLDLRWRSSSKSGTEGLDISTGEERIFGWEGPRLTARGLTEFIIDESLKKRQWNYLNTLTIAYLSPDMPAFRNWPELLDKFYKNRQILLNHPARIMVDLDRVPESSWKNKLKDSRKGIPLGQAYMLGGAQAKLKDAVDSGADIIPGKKEPEGNPIPIIPISKNKIRLPDDEKAKSGGGVAVIAAAALGAVILSKK
jgi:hypothetical protein